MFVKLWRRRVALTLAHVGAVSQFAAFGAAGLGTLILGGLSFSILFFPASSVLSSHSHLLPFVSAGCKKCCPSTLAANHSVRLRVCVRACTCRGHVTVCHAGAVIHSEVSGNTARSLPAVSALSPRSTRPFSFLLLFFFFGFASCAVFICCNRREICAVKSSRSDVVRSVSMLTIT